MLCRNRSNSSREGDEDQEGSQYDSESSSRDVDDDLGESDLCRSARGVICSNEAIRKKLKKKKGKKKSVAISVIIGSTWSIFKEENATPMLPQETETAICHWLIDISTRLQLIDNPSKIYGNIIFHKSICGIRDFQISTLTEEMLKPGWDNWMNTLASGEILLDIINGILSYVHLVMQTTPFNSNFYNEVLLKYPEGYPVRRMIDAFPGTKATMKFLLNHYVIINEFLRPILSRSGGEMKYLMKTFNEIAHYKYTLLNRHENTKLETWKNYMVVITTIMSIFGCASRLLENQLKSLLDHLTDERLAVPVLAKGYKLMIRRTDHLITTDIEFKGNDVIFPYFRIMREGFFHTLPAKDTDDLARKMLEKVRKEVPLLMDR